MLVTLQVFFIYMKSIKTKGEGKFSQPVFAEVKAKVAKKMMKKMGKQFHATKGE